LNFKQNLLFFSAFEPFFILLIFSPLYSFKTFIVIFLLIENHKIHLLHDLEDHAVGPIWAQTIQFHFQILSEKKKKEKKKKPNFYP